MRKLYLNIYEEKKQANHKQVIIICKRKTIKLRMRWILARSVLPSTIFIREAEKFQRMRVVFKKMDDKCIF